MTKKPLAWLYRRTRSSDSITRNGLRLLLSIATIGTIGQLFASNIPPLSNEDQSLRFSLELDHGELFYHVESLDSGNTAVKVIERSPLGISRDDSEFVSGLQFVRTGNPVVIDDPYQLLSGKKLDIENRAIEQTYIFKNRQNNELNLIVRAMDDAVAFRYAFESSSDSTAKIIVENTGFKVPETGSAWMLPYEKVSQWAPSYEMAWQNKIDIGKTVESEYAGWALPALFNVRNHWVLITEAGMDGSCYAAHLEPEAPNGLYKVRLPEDNETYGVAEKEANIQFPWESPWRVIVIGNQLNTILESNIATDLSEPCALPDTSWIQPGRVSWSWWSDKGSPYDYNRIVPFVDLSADYGWEYTLVDLGWENMRNGSIGQLIEYSKKKGVGLILWYNSGGDHNQLYGGVRDKMVDPVVRRTELKKLQSWGVKGIKVDFMQSDKQYVIQLYIDILKDAAEHHLFVDFHGCTMPRGWARTYPNLLTQEAVRGAEQYWDPDFAEQAHMLHTIYPFTRNVVGSMDYTPVIFGRAPELERNKTTNAHELALSVIFESGLQHFVDSISAYRSQPEYIQSFLKQVPVTWDETILIDGFPGDRVILARRKGDSWWVAGLNGRTSPRIETVDFSFLPKGCYKANIIEDGSARNKSNHRELEISSDTTVDIPLLERGGFAIELKPIN